MTPEQIAGHAPPSHRRRMPLVKLSAVIILSVLVVAGAVLVALTLLPNGQAPEPNVMVAAPAESSAPGTSSEGSDMPTASDEVPEAVVIEEVNDPNVDSSFRITDVTPADGSIIGGEAVVITGSGFREGVMVRVEGRDASQVEVLNERKLRVVLPPGLPGDASVAVGTAVDVPYTAEGLFTYVDRPPRVVMAVRPTLGSLAGGTAITIVGTGFEPGARVVLGGERAVDVEVIDSTRITAMTPAHEAGIVDVVVRNPDMPAAILPGAFEFVPGPTLTGIDPVDIPELGGVPVTIRGTGFAPGMEVTFNGLAASDVLVVDDTMMTVTAPPGLPGPATIVARNPGQPPATLLDAVFYFVPPPIEESVPPEVDAALGDVAPEDPAAASEPIPADPGVPADPAPADPAAPESVPSAEPPVVEGADPAAG